MLVTLLGMTTLVSFSQPRNAALPMLVTPSGITTFLTRGSSVYFFKTPFSISNPMMFPFLYSSSNSSFSISLMISC